MVITGRAPANAIGVSIDRRTIRVLALRGGRITCCDEVTRADDIKLPDLLVGLLGRALEARYARPSVYATVGLDSGQLRNVAGPKWTDDRKLARAIIEENASRFFLVNGVSVVTTSVSPGPRGQAWVGALERSVVDALIESCRALRLRLASVSPLGMVLGYATDARSIVWREGDLAIVVRYEQARLCYYRRMLAAEMPAHDALIPSSELTELGEKSESFMPAFGAARGGRRIAAAFRPGANGTYGRSRLIFAASACAITFVAALAAPPLLAAWRAGTNLEQRSAIARSGALALQNETELNEAVKTVLELNAFEYSRKSATLLLAELTEAIDQPTMLLSAQVDTLGGTLVALTPNASSLIAMLDSVKVITDSHLIGPVTQEPRSPSLIATTSSPASAQDSERPVVRVTVRFLWRDRFQSSSDLVSVHNGIVVDGER